MRDKNLSTIGDTPITNLSMAIGYLVCISADGMNRKANPPHPIDHPT